MKQTLSAGLLMCRKTSTHLAYFLVHPGGPFFKNKDAGAWSIPKGLPEGNEDLLVAARREFFEETGIQPVPPFHALGNVIQKNRKQVHAWTFLGQWSPESGIVCNTFSIEWPPRSGRHANFPEVDQARWMSYEDAVQAIIPAQRPLLDRAREIWSKS